MGIGQIKSASAADFAPWKRHVIDQSSKGADGVRWVDINQDALPDFVTGWEEGGIVKAYLHPGVKQVREPWPNVRVGRAPSVEDAVWIDLDGDGAWDVLSSCEGGERSLRVHWGPSQANQLLEASAWQTDVVGASQGLMMWMFALPSRETDVGAPRLWAAGKGPTAALGWWEYPGQARVLSDWQWRPQRPVGWIMSLLESDMDSDGDADIVFTDRRGPRRGCYWSENPGSKGGPKDIWKEHLIGAKEREAMFMHLADLDGDGWEDAVVALKSREIGWYRRLDASGLNWEAHSIGIPASAGTAKAVAVGDMDLDGQPDLVFSCEQAEGALSGVMWLKSIPALQAKDSWSARDMSGPEGVKFDLVELLDLDGDGDLDVVTCEERENLGVIWFENPHRSPVDQP